MALTVINASAAVTELSKSHESGFDGSVGRALHRHLRGRGFVFRSEPDFFLGLCSSSVTAALALMTVITQLLLMGKIYFNHGSTK